MCSQAGLLPSLALLSSDAVMVFELLAGFVSLSEGREASPFQITRFFAVKDGSHLVEKQVDKSNLSWFCLSSYRIALAPCARQLALLWCMVVTCSFLGS